MYLGADIGGTNARLALVDEGGRLVKVAKAALSDRSPAGVASTLAQLLAELAPGQLPRLGVGLAGMIQGSVVVNAPNLGWRDVDFGGLLSQALKTPVRLVNDLSAAAWGEHRAGVAKGCADTFTVFVGTGVGSAVIAHGALVQGATGVAGEFGHVKIVPTGGRACGCGQQGCLEAYVGGARLTAWMKEVGLTGTPADLEAAAVRGEAKAIEVYDFAADALALAIANQVTFLNPAMVVLGGGVLNHCPGMVRRIREAVARYSSVAAGRAVRLELAALGDDSGLVGAAFIGA